MTQLRTSRLFITLFLFVALACTGFTAADAQRGSAPAATSATKINASARPRLVLLIVVDQFRYDYLERFDDLFVDRGFKRLLGNGASWVNANYDHFPTYTAPGHATLLTGAWPSETGIIGNEWPERETRSMVSNSSDPEDRPEKGRYILLGGNGTDRGLSPRRLMASTVGDELRLVTNDRSKVIGISLKDRAAIMTVGRHANAAYWFDVQTGNMVSSSYYFDQLPAWVQAFNQSRPMDKYFGARWERLLPELIYLKRAGADAPAWESVGKKPEEMVFPHVITGGATSPSKAFFDEIDGTPFSNDMLVDFASKAIVNENLGGDEDTDLLSLSFSANDLIGHRFGPYSQEVMDITLRTDRQIATLLDFVDRRVGLENTVVVFSADHGVAPIPEHAAAMGLAGGRIKTADVLSAVRNAIELRYGRMREGRNGEPNSTVDYIQKFADRDRERDGLSNGNLYFNLDALKRDGISLDEIERVAGEAALRVEGIARYFTRAEFQQGAIPLADPVARRVLHGFSPKRSGDVILIYDAFKYLGDSSAATHGSPYSYDTHVPLIIMSARMKPGKYLEAATPADIAPTLAAILNIQAPSNSVGRVLNEGIRPAQASGKTSTRR